MQAGLFERVIATLQIAGASATAVMLIQHLGQGGSGLVSLIIFVAMFVLFALTFMAGIWLWSGEVRGYRWTALSLALQVPVMQSVVLSWKFVFGFGMVLFVAGEPGKIDFNVGGSSQFYLMTPGVPFLLGINLYALLALALILKRQSAAEQAVAPRVRQSGPAVSGALMYAGQISRLADFYRDVAGAIVRQASPERIVMQADELQFVIHELPQTGEAIPEGSRLKLFFTVPSLDIAGQTAVSLGGRVIGERWPGPMFDTANIADPEGNIFHLRENR